MSKDKLTDYSATNSLNTDVGGVNIDEGMLPSDVNDALREVMTHLKDFAEGTQAVNNIRFAGATTTGDINFGDNDKAVFGAGSDLQIYHTGTQSIIEDVGTGPLRIRSNSISIENELGTETISALTQDGAVTIYYDGSPKLATTATGADITGTLTADGLTVDTSAGININGTGTGAIHNINRGTGATNLPRPVMDIELNSTGNVVDNFGPSLRFRISDTGVSNSELGGIGFLRDGGDGSGKFVVGQGAETLQSSQQFSVASNGDVSLYADDGTTQGFFWDASTQRLGINTTSPGARLQVGGNAKLGSASQTTFSGSLTTGGLDVMVGSGASSAGAFQVWDDNELTTPRFTVTREGNVGIGTASPSAPLHIYNASNPYVSCTDATNYFNSGVITSSYGLINSSLPISFQISDSEKMRIDSSGNLGVGTSSPSYLIHADAATSTDPSYITASSGSAFIVAMGSQNSPGVAQEAFIGTLSDHALKIKTNNTERLRIDSSGNLLVGKTNNALANDGIVIRGGGELLATNTSDLSGNFNRLSTDGGIVGFYKDGTSVGVVGASSSDVYIGTGDTGFRFQDGSDAIVPFNTTTLAASDNVLSLGGGSSRFKDLYLSGGVYLGGTGSANLLDDYEEGTWTPTNAGATLTVTQAKYTKVGRMVTVACYVVADANTSGDWGGLPFSVDVAGTYSGSVGYQNDATTETWNVFADSGTQWTLRKGATQEQLASGKNLRMTLTYFTT